MTGQIQVYTGNGKGKTTASLGLALRAIGAGYKVCIIQFMKGQMYSELKSLEMLKEHITLERYGHKCFIKGEASEEQIALAQAGLRRAAEVLKQGEHHIVILDEANVAIFFKLFTTQQLIEAIQQRAPHVEVIVTGRNAPEELIQIAGLVTEMREIKHYYNNGVYARRGIENKKK